MLDELREIVDTLWKNKLRTLLTALSVAWGIFMLVLLLAVGQGLQNAAEHDFHDDTVNSIWLWGGRTLKPYKGRSPGRDIRFLNTDYEMLRDQIPGVEHITSRYYLSGQVTASYRGRHASFEVCAVHPDHRHLEGTIMVRGRFLNDRDVKYRRKVAAIGVDTVEPLFGGTDPVGRFVDVNGIHYRVVGVYRDTGNERELRKIYVPVSTAQLAYRGGDNVHAIMLTLDDEHARDSRAMATHIRRAIARRHAFDVTDKGAMRLRDRLETYNRLVSVFMGIRVFVWIVGIGTVVAGLVGVSNIMLITVRERTREIGLRKVLGATCGSIMRLIVQEALLITSVSGYAGLVAGVALVEAARAWIPANDYVRDPEVNFGAAVGATVLVALTGVLAGLFPAQRAARVNPIVALRDE